MRERIQLAVMVLAILLLGSPPVLAQEYIRDVEAIPESVDRVVTPFDQTFQEKPSPPGLFPGLAEKLKDTPPFLRDTKLDLNFRTYYFYRDQYDDSKSEAWALGGLFPTGPAGFSITSVWEPCSILPNRSTHRTTGMGRGSSRPASMATRWSDSSTEE